MMGYWIFVFVLFLFIAFIVVTLIDIMKQSRLTAMGKIVWAAVVLGFPFIGSAVYYWIVPLRKR